MGAFGYYYNNRQEILYGRESTEGIMPKLPFPLRPS